MALKRLDRQKFGPWEKRLVRDEDRKLIIEDPTIQWDPLCWVNNRYSVQVSYVQTEWGMVTHLWIRRHIDKPARSWPDLMRIKNEIVGENRVAIEVFPIKDEVVDQANMTHLWVLPPKMNLPFALNQPKELRHDPAQ